MSRIIRGFDRSLRFRFIFAQTKEIVEEARIIHQTSTTATAAIGRLLTQAVIMGTELKGDKDSLTLTLQGNGPAGKLIAVADSHHHVKGYLEHPEIEIPSREDHKLDVGAFIGYQGVLSVVRDYGLKEPYQAKSPIVSGEIAEDFAYYYANSEQIPTFLVLGVLVDTDCSVKAAGGLLIQAMPGVKDEEFSDLEECVHNLPGFSNLLVDLSMEDILSRYFAKMDFEVLAEDGASYHCDCSEEKVRRALKSIGNDELKSLQEENENTEVVCEFCNTKYSYTKEDLQTFMEERGTKE